MIDTAILLTAYNRPTLVADAIASVYGQDCDRWHLYILDDGSSEICRQAIHAACGNPVWRYVKEVKNGVVTDSHDGKVTWWKGPQRSMEDRKASISYSATLNIALNSLLRDEAYLTFLCDDDWMPAHSVRKRAEYLDTHPEAHVVYGRLRAIQFDADGKYNLWQHAEAPISGRDFIEPDGERIFNYEAGNGRTYFLNGVVDPITKAPYVEEGFWLPGPFRYGERYRIDHNQAMIRRKCLTECQQWPRRNANFLEFWPEDLSYGVGDAGFFQRLADIPHDFIGVDCWAACKRYHKFSDGCSSAEMRE